MIPPTPDRATATLNAIGEPLQTEPLLWIFTGQRYDARMGPRLLSMLVNSGAGAAASRAIVRQNAAKKKPPKPAVQQPLPKPKAPK